MSACGFHLRGLMVFPSSLQNLYILVPTNGRDLKIKLEDQLKAYRVHPVPNVTQATYQLIIDDLKFTRQIANISSSTTPRQFQLIYTVEYHFIDAQGHHLIPQGRAQSQRLVSMNSERLLGSNYEQDFFMHEMEDELCTQILTTINHATMTPS